MLLQLGTSSAHAASARFPSPPVETTRPAVVERVQPARTAVFEQEEREEFSNLFDLDKETMLVARKWMRKAPPKSNNGKVVASIVVGGIVVVPASAGFAFSQSQRKRKDQGDKETTVSNHSSTSSSPPKTAGFTMPKPTTKPFKGIDVDSEMEVEGRKLLEKSLKKAKAAKKDFDAKEYMKSIQKEKAAIASELESLRKSRTKEKEEIPKAAAKNNSGAIKETTTQQTGQQQTQIPGK